jgi:hypothetical protein
MYKKLLTLSYLREEAEYIDKAKKRKMKFKSEYIYIKIKRINIK